MKSLDPAALSQVDGEVDRTPGPVALIIIALFTPLAACAVMATMRDALPNTNAALVLVLLVVAVAAAGHRPSGLLAALSSAVWFDYFLTEPYHRFTISDRDDVETAVLLTVVGVAVTEIALWGRRQQARASRGQGYLDGVVSAARMAAAGQEADTVVAFVSDQIADVLGVDRCRYRPGPPGGRPRLNADGSVTRDGHEVDVDRIGFPTEDEVELAVERGGSVLGHFVLSCTSHVVWPSLEQRLVAVTLAEQAGAALEAATSIPKSRRATFEGNPGTEEQ